jgi:hypothetical protein
MHPFQKDDILAMIQKFHPAEINRLKRGHGHLASTIAMFEGDWNCLEVAQQMHAEIKALEAPWPFSFKTISTTASKKWGLARENRVAINKFRQVARYL